MLRLLLTVMLLGVFCAVFWPVALVLIVLAPVLWLLFLPLLFVGVLLGGLWLLVNVLVVWPVRAMTRI